MVYPPVPSTCMHALIQDTTSFILVSLSLYTPPPQAPLLPSPLKAPVFWLLLPPAPAPPTGANPGLPLPPPLPQLSPLSRLLLVLDVVLAPSWLFLTSSSSSMLNRPCSSSMRSRLMLLLLTARSRGPRRVAGLPMLEAEVRRVRPGCWGLEVGRGLKGEVLGVAASSREEMRVRCSCWLIMLMEAWRGGDETKGLVSPEEGRLRARREGEAPGCRLELRRGEPTWPKAEAPGEPDSSESGMGRDLPQSDWKREGDAVAAEGEP